MSYTEQELSLLTPEERAAVEDPEYSAEELAALKGVADSSDADDDEGDDDDEAIEGEIIEGRADEATPAVVDAKASDTPAAEPVAEVQAAPITYEFRLPDDYDDQVKRLADESKALKESFKNGDIDVDQYDEQLAALQDQRDELKAIKTKAEIAQDMTQQNSAKTWQNTVNAFVVEVAKSDKLDYRNDPDKLADFDLFVKRLGEDTRHNDKSMRWFLEEAHKRVMALHGLKAEVVDPEPKKDTKADAKAARKPPIDDVPKTLAQVPGGDGPGDLAGEFAHLDQLDGYALEDALAKMNPTQRARYLAMA